MDTSVAGSFFAQILEQLGEDFPDDGETFVRTVGVIIEIDTGEATEIQVSASDERPWVRLALLREGIVAIEQAMDESRDSE